MAKYAQQPVSPADAPVWCSPLLRDIVQWTWNTLRGPTARKVYTIAELPDPTEWDGTTLAISDGAAGRPIVTAVNGAWYYSNGSAV